MKAHVSTPLIERLLVPEGSSWSCFHRQLDDDGDLVLPGSNLPHTWVSRERAGPGPHVAREAAPRR